MNPRPLPQFGLQIRVVPDVAAARLPILVPALWTPFTLLMFQTLAEIATHDRPLEQVALLQEPQALLLPICMTAQPACPESD